MKRLALALLAAGALVVAIFQLVPWQADTAIDPSDAGSAEAVDTFRGEVADAAADKAPVADLAADAVGTGAAGGPSRKEIGVAKIRVSGRLVAAGGLRVPPTTIHVHLGDAKAPRMPMMFYGAKPRAKAPDAVVQSDAGGRFAFEVPRDEAGRVTLADSDLVWAKSPPRFLGSGSNLDLGDLGVRKGAVLRGRVVSETDSPIAKARLQYINYENVQTSKLVESDATGRFELRGLVAGMSYVTVSCAGYTTFYRQMEVKPGKAQEDVILRLRRGATLIGTVVDDRMKPIEGAKVSVTGSGKSVPGGGYEYSNCSAKTDKNGEFRVSGLCGGPQHNVNASAKGHQSKSTRVKVEDGPVRLQLTRLATVSGELVDELGHAIAGSRVVATHKDPRGGTASKSVNTGLASVDASMWNAAAARGRSAKTDEHGKFTIERIKPGRVWLVATGAHHKAVHGPMELVAGAQADEVRVAAERGAVARIRVVDPQGEPVAKARVTLRQPGEKSPPRAPGPFLVDGMAVSHVVPGPARPGARKSATTDAKGMCEIAGVEPGAYELTASHKSWVSPAPVPVKMPKKGRIDSRLEMEAGGMVDVAIIDHLGKPAAEQSFRIFAKMDIAAAKDKKKVKASGSGRTDSTGRATVGPIKAGEYEAALQLSRGRPGMMMWGYYGAKHGGAEIGERVTFRVVAEETAEVRLTCPELAIVVGTVSDASGPVCNAFVAIAPVLTDPAIRNNWALRSASMRQARTDERGRYRLEGLQGGKFMIAVQRTRKEIAFREEIELAPAGEQRKDLFLLAGAVELTLKHDGKPVAGVRVTLQNTSSVSGPMMWFGSGNSSNAQSDESGVARFDAVPPGTYSMRYSDKKYLQPGPKVRIEVERGATVKREMKLASAASLRIEARAAPGTVKLRMFQLETKLAGSDDKPKVRWLRGPAGDVRSLPPGRYVVRARRRRSSKSMPKPQWSVPQEIELAAGKTGKVRIVVP